MQGELQGQVITRPWPKNNEYQHGTRIQFLPDEEIFKEGIELDYNDYQYKIKANNDNEFITANKTNNNINDAAADGSVFTGNSSNFQKHSKNEVKLYLKEVKSRVDPIIFKEFIQNIKLLTSSKEKNGVERSTVIEKVRILFGEQFKDLFIKFESILGFTNN